MFNYLKKLFKLECEGMDGKITEVAADGIKQMSIGETMSIRISGVAYIFELIGRDE